MVFSLVLMVVGAALVFLGVQGWRRKLPHGRWQRIHPVALAADDRAAALVVAAAGTAGFLGGVLSALMPDGAVDWFFVGSLGMCALAGVGTLRALYATRRTR